MIKKIFVLALILIAVNYFYGAKIAAWWQSWRSGAKVSNYSQQLANKAAEEFKNQSAKYSEQLIKATAASLSEEGKKKIDSWLKENKLNEYGDPQGTNYNNNTPLTNTQTGEIKNRFELILNKWPDLINRFQLSVDELKKNIDKVRQQNNNSQN